MIALSHQVATADIKMSCPVKKGSTALKKKKEEVKKKESRKREVEHSAGATDLLSAVAKVSLQPSAVGCLLPPS